MNPLNYLTTENVIEALTITVVHARLRHRFYGELKHMAGIWHEIPLLGRPNHRGPEIPYMTRCGYLARPFELRTYHEAPVGRRLNVTCLGCLADPTQVPLDIDFIDESGLE